MTYRLRLCQLSLAAAVLAASLSCSKSPAEHISAGDKYFAQGLINEALVEYRGAVQKDPMSGEARKKLAAAFERSGDLARALREYVRAADLLPDDAAVQAKAGWYLLRAGRFEEAKARAKQATSKDPKNLEAQLVLAGAMAGLEDLDGAIKQIKDAIELDPDQSRAYFNLGALQLQKGDRDSAEAAFKKAVELDPKSIGARLALGQFLWLTGRPADGEREFREAYNRDPKNVPLNKTLATFMLATGRGAEAEPFLRAAADNSKDVAARFLLVDYYMAMKKNDEGRRLLTSLMAEPEHWAMAKIRMAGIEYSDGRAQQARDTLQEVLSSQPGNPEAQLAMARLLAAQNKVDEAIVHAKAAVSADPKAAGAYYLMGTLYAGKKDEAAAITAFEEVLKVNPRAVPAQLQIARLRLATGEPGKAVELADRAVASQPSPQARLLLAQALVASGESGELARAESELKKLAADYPDAAPVAAEMGALEARKGNDREARKSFERALALDENSNEAIWGLVSLDLAAKKYPAAIARVEAALKRRPGSAPMALLAARTYMAGGNPSRAESLLKTAVQSDPSNLPAYGMLGQIYMSQNRLEDALKEFEGLAARQTRPVGAQTMAGVLLESMGKPEEARKRYEAALSLDPTAAIAANNLAWMTAESGGNLDVALQLAQTAKRGMPNQPQVDDTLGWIYYKKGMTSLALPLLESAAKAFPKHAGYHYHLAMAYSKAGQLSKAEASLAEATRLNPKFVQEAEAKRMADSK